MDYEYVALEWATDHWMQDEAFLRDEMDLLDRGWEEDSRATWQRRRTGGACIMRRPKDAPQKYFHTRHCLCDECGKKRDEPRKWTKGELQKLIAHDRELVKSILEDAQTEADMQTAYSKELQKRNAKLQAAIDEVANIERYPGLDWSSARCYGEIQATIHRFLYPLATKKED